MMRRPASVTISGTASKGQVLTASNTLADADGLGAISYQWQRDGADIAGATGTTYTLGNADVGHTIDVVANYTDGHGTAEAVTSAATAVGHQRQRRPDRVGDDQRDGAREPGADGIEHAGGCRRAGRDQLPVAARRGRHCRGHRDRATRWAMPMSATPSTWWRSYTDGHGTAESVTSAATAAVPTSMMRRPASVTISGTASKGQVLTASNTLADADGLGAISYQWQRDGTNIAGATGTTYTLGECRRRPHHRCGGELHRRPRHGRERAECRDRRGDQRQRRPDRVGDDQRHGAREPGADGVEHAGGCRRARRDQLPVAARRGQHCRGHRDQLYALAMPMSATAIVWWRSYTDGHGTAESVASAATPAVTNVNDAPTGTVTISGTRVQGPGADGVEHAGATPTGSARSATSGSATGPTSPGPPARTYTLGNADVGHTIDVVASYTDGHGTAESVASAATAVVTNVNDAPTGSVTISGTAHENQVLTASNTLADADGLGAISYQWQRDGVNIVRRHRHQLYALAMPMSATPSMWWRSYTDGHGTAESVASAATAAVTNVNDAPTGTVTISGTASKGQVLTASNTLADADGLGAISYQWQRDGVDVAGATGTSLHAGQCRCRPHHRCGGELHRRPWHGGERGQCGDRRGDQRQRRRRPGR